MIFGKSDFITSSPHGHNENEWLIGGLGPGGLGPFESGYP